MKRHISWTWLFGFKALDYLSRHQWMFNLISGSLQPLKGRELSNPNVCSWKASYRRMRSWPWQASSMSVIFNSCFLLILVVIRPMTFIFVCLVGGCFLIVFLASCAGRWLWLHCGTPSSCQALLYGSLAVCECCCILKTMLTWKRSQMQARYIVTYKCLYSTLKSNITSSFNHMPGRMFCFCYIKALCLNWFE